MFTLLVLLFCCTLQQTIVQVYQTSKYSSDRITKKNSITFEPAPVWPTISVHVNTTDKRQALTGIGGALTEASAIVFSEMPSTLQDEFLDLYYVQNKYTHGRLEINACDFSLGNWSSDNTKGDYSLSDFKLSDHDVNTIIPLVQRVLKINPNLVIFASPWSPPGWLKKSGSMEGSEPNCLIEDDQVYDTWAEYYVKWIESYSKFGISVDMVTTQNEPTIGSWAVKYEACMYDPEHLAKFTKVLIPKMQKIGVKVLIVDDNKNQLENYVNSMFSDTYIQDNVFGIAFHWYAGPFFNVIEDLRKRYPNTVLMATEACNGPGPSPGNFDRAEGYAFDIIGDFGAGTTFWMDWNILLNEQGGPNHQNNFCDAPILYDRKTQQMIVNPMYYYLGQFSRFIDSGKSKVIGNWITIDTSRTEKNNQPKISSTAFSRRNDDGMGNYNETITIVVLNQDEIDYDVTLTDPMVGFSPTTIPRRSITTFVYQK